MQNHRIGDIGDMELVKTDQPVLLRHAFAQSIQWVNRALKCRQLPMHFPHKFMKVQTRLALERHCAKKAVHQKAFAATDAAVQVNTAWDFRSVQQFLKGIGPLFLEVPPFCSAALQSCNRSQLSWITGVPAQLQLALIGDGYRQQLTRLP